MADRSFWGGYKEGIEMAFRDMEVLYSRTKYDFNRKLAFLTQLTLIQNWHFHFILIFNRVGNRRQIRDDSTFWLHMFFLIYICHPLSEFNRTSMFYTESFIASNGGVGSRTYLVDSADQNTDYTMLTLDLNSDGVASSFLWFDPAVIVLWPG